MVKYQETAERVSIRTELYNDYLSLVESLTAQWPTPCADCGLTH